MALDYDIVIEESSKYFIIDVALRQRIVPLKYGARVLSWLLYNHSDLENVQ